MEVAEYLKGATRRIVRASALGVAVLMAGLSTTAVADESPRLTLDVHHHETNYAAGGTGELWFEISNVGDTQTSGSMSLTVQLPAGLTRSSTRMNTTVFTQPGEINWSCPGAAGTATFTCTTNESLPRHRTSRSLIAVANVAPGISGERFVSARLSGGGAPDAPAAAGCAAGLAACAFERVRISETEADFGVVDGSFRAEFVGSDYVSPFREAGGHPEAAAVSFDLNSVPTVNPLRKRVSKSIRNLTVSFPAGFVGDPTAVDQCSALQLVSYGCPASSQVGKVELGLSRSAPLPDDYDVRAVGIYNMIPERGAIADLAFAVNATPVHIMASLDPTNNYTVVTKVPDINESLVPYDSKVTIWGHPAASRHDSERCGGLYEGNLFNTSSSCSSDGPDKPFLTTPSTCNTDHAITLSKYDSWQNSGVFGPDITYDLGSFTACDDVPFDADVNLTPTNPKADAPTGLEVEVTVPQNDDPEGIATSSLKDAVVTLPGGMATNPAAADGLGACSPEQISLGTDDEVKCPNNSKIGTAILATPVLHEPVSGSVYLATQHQNPFDSLLAMYLVLEDPERGLLIKLPGKIDADPQTGQLTTTFANNPQLPFSSLKLKLKGGNRAPLVNPPTCGTKTLSSRLAPWANPDEVVSGSSSYEITQTSNGSPCPATEADRPFDPTLKAGTIGAQAGSHSPFVLRLTRPEGDQTLSALKLQMPPGLTAKLAGVSQCPDSTLNAISSQAGTAAAESSSPSCPANSKVGVATVGAGSGNPVYVQTGKAYLAGPYKGAPLSLAVVVPALSGPFDLGTEVVRNKLIVDPRTAEITVESDPFPEILHGIPLRLRDVRVRINRDSFMLTGTNCDPLQISSQITGSGGAVATPSNHFQVAGCGDLGFSPDLDLSFGNAKKNTLPNSHPQLDAKLAFNSGDANISSVEVALPQGVFLDQDRLGRICSRANYAAQSCPAESQVGYAKATTPLLDDPVEGPVYLKASDNPLPDLAADLDGLVDIDLFGRIDQKQNKKGLNQIRNTFDVVPDVPVSDFELTLEGGSEGLLVNSRNICRSKKAQKVSIQMSAHNGYSLSEKPLIGSACSKLAKKDRKKAKKLSKKAAKLQKKAKKAKRKARKASGKTATKLLRKSKKLKRQAKKLRRQARKLGR